MIDRTTLVKGIGAVAIVLFAGLAIWKWNGWQEKARAGSAYAVRVTCACRYIEGRSMESCAQDLSDVADHVRLTDDPQAKQVSGSVPLLGSASARFKPGYGCLMEPK